MIAELGHLALVVALIAALFQAFFALVGAHRNDTVWMQIARTAAGVQFVAAIVAFAALAAAFLATDFSVLYVAQNANSALPWPYRIAAVWGAHEGSLLLWSLVLAAWTLAVAHSSRSLPETFASRVLGVLGLVSVGFLLFTLATSNPFTRLLPPAAEGRDLNPILQDPALVMHPPMLYVGYVGFSVAFAFACAALIGRELDTTWARWARPWTTAAWLFLTIGIALGSWWAYYELGWGGWWFWDPVENASFMPWLVGTALIHSLAVTEKRGAFVAWTMLLAIAAFSLSLLGTFLVRSGVLVSVHAFASDPSRGIFILALLAVTIGGALTLYAWRAPLLPAGGGFRPLSRETFLLFNNVLLTVAAASVLLGTLYPLFLDALDLGKISVGPPYFNAVFVPLMLPLLLLVGVGPYINWKRDTAGEVIQRLRGISVLALVLAVTLIVVFDLWREVMAAAGLAVSAWVIVTAWLDVAKRMRAGMSSIPLTILGMTLAHFGAGLTALGITLVTTLGVVRDVRLAPDTSVELAGYTFHLERFDAVRGPNYDATRATITVTRDGEPVAVLHPEKRIYHATRMPMTEAGIAAGLTRDLYVALGEQLEGGAWSARVQYKPGVRFIWLGALVMALGGLLAMLDRRYRGRPAGESP